MEWLLLSLVLSVVLTVVLNVVLRLFPGAADRAGRELDRLVSPPAQNRGADDRRVRVYFPWKAMLVASIVLTVVLNVVLRLA